MLRAMFKCVGVAAIQVRLGCKVELCIQYSDLRYRLEAQAVALSGSCV